MPDLDQIPAFVAENQIEPALQVLANTAAEHPDFLNDVLHLQNRWAEFNARQKRGELSFEEENRQHARIVDALLDLHSRMSRRIAGPALSSRGKRSWPIGQWPLFLSLIVAAALLLFYLVTRNHQTFEFTVHLKRKPGAEISLTYPPLKNAKLILQLANESKPAEVKSLGKYAGEADFKNIAANYRNQLVAVSFADIADLNRPIYWRLLPDSVRLDGKDQTLWIVPDGSLSHIRGKVMDAITAQPLSGVILDMEGITDTSDSNGRYELHIPPGLQRSEYSVSAQLSTHAPGAGSVKPATEPNLEILLSPLKHEK